MKKLYTTILIIALALFISCDEKKAKDEITKALDKAVDAVDKTTPKLTKPVLNATRVRVGTAATFPKVAGYTYTLKEKKRGVRISEGTSNTMQVTATQAASGVVVVATKDGNSIDSEPIEFVIIELTKPAVSSYRVRTVQVATFPKVLGHTYELKQAISGVSLEVSDESMGRVTATQAASNVIIVATLDGNTEESDPIEFVLIELIKPAVSSNRVKVGTPIILTKVEAHTYKLKEEVSGVSLEVSDESTGELTATQSAQNVIIVATLDGNTEESDPINFIEVIKPAVSEISAPWDTVITFPKEPEHTYELKEEKTGVTLSEATSDTMQITATQSAQNVIIIATVDGLTEESDRIEFRRKQGNALSFAQPRRSEKRRTTFTQTASKSGAVAGDTRDITYSVYPSVFGVSVDSSSGEVAVNFIADYRRYTITAQLPRTAKYERSTATYTLVVPRSK